MTEPVAPWSEYARSEWARIEAAVAQLDEEPWEPIAGEVPEGGDLLDLSAFALVAWGAAVAVVGGALLLVLAAVGLRHVLTGGTR